MNIIIGKNVQQKEGYVAFVPYSFPPKALCDVPRDVLGRVIDATHIVGRLDGVARWVPDVEYFLKMFYLKDAVASSQIEGTQSSIADVLEYEVVKSSGSDADEVERCVSALQHGIESLGKLPVSLRLIRGMHKKLMVGARSTQFADPGNFRKSQNWIGGTKPGNAVFVPPTIDAMQSALSDLEKFLHHKGRGAKDIPPLIAIGVSHAQFETIHPFLDGNGRVGRNLITVLLCHKKLLLQPTLFISSYFKNHQKQYYAKLTEYREGGVWGWVSFFLDAVIETAEKSIAVLEKVRELYVSDMEKMQKLSKRESESGVLVLKNLFRQPIITVSIVAQWTGFTSAGAQGVINRLVSLKILEKHKNGSLRKSSYIYRRYNDIFEDE